MSNSKKWEEFYIKSKKLSKPCSIDGLLTKQEINDLEKAVIRVLNVFLIAMNCIKASKFMWIILCEMTLYLK